MIRRDLLHYFESIDGKILHLDIQITGGALTIGGRIEVSKTEKAGTRPLSQALWVLGRGRWQSRTPKSTIVNAHLHQHEGASVPMSAFLSCWPPRFNYSKPYIVSIVVRCELKTVLQNFLEALCHMNGAVSSMAFHTVLTPETKLPHRSL